MSRLLGISLVFASLGASNLVYAAPNKAVVLVFPLEDTTKKVAAATLDGFHDFLTAELGRRPGFSVLPRGEIRNRLANEKAESYKACHDDACQIEIGKELAANKVVATRISMLGSKCLVSAYLYDLARTTSDATGSATCDCSDDGIANAVAEIAKQLAGAKTDESSDRHQGEWVHGIQLSPLEPKDFAKYRVPRDVRGGVLITAVAAESAAASVGIKDGDIILRVGIVDPRRPIVSRDIMNMDDALRVQDAPGRSFILKLLRAGRQETITVRPHRGSLKALPNAQQPRRKVITPGVK